MIRITTVYIDLGFVLNPCMVRRMRHVLDILSTHVPDHSTRFSIRRTYRLDKRSILSRPTLCGTDRILNIIYKPATEVQDLLCTTLHSAVHKKPYGIILNAYTGEVTEVHIPLEKQEDFLGSTLKVKDSYESDLDDSMFIRRNRLRF